MDAILEWIVPLFQASKVFWIVVVVPLFLLALLSGRVTMKRMRDGDFG